MFQLKSQAPGQGRKQACTCLRPASFSSWVTMVNLPPRRYCSLLSVKYQHTSLQGFFSTWRSLGLLRAVAEAGSLLHVAQVQRQASILSLAAAG